MPASTDPLLASALLRPLIREVWVITAAANQQLGGLTATWVHVASIDRRRPQLVIGLDPNHHTTQLVDASQTFVAHLLAARQIDLAWRMASESSRTSDKLRNLVWEPGMSGAPRLRDCVAWFDCQVVSRIVSTERIYYWADVRACSQTEATAALTDRDFIAALTPEQRRTLAERQEEDIRQHDELRTGPVRT